MPQDEEVEWQGVRVGEGEGHAKEQGTLTEVKNMSNCRHAEKTRKSTPNRREDYQNHKSKPN